MNVAAEKNLVAFAVHMYMLEAFVKKRAAALIAFVDGLRVTLLQSSHEFGKVVMFLRLQHEMKMIGHEAVGDDSYSEFDAAFF